MLLYFRAWRATKFVRLILVREMDIPEELVKSFHSHCIRVCISTLASRDGDVSNIAARVMNHSDVMAKSYQRNNKRPALELSSFMDSQVKRVPTPFVREIEDGEINTMFSYKFFLTVFLF